jgi:ATP adenylyltransferase
MIVGTGIAHFHQHMFARYADTPRPYDWAHSHEWPDAPHGNSDDITDLCTRLRPYFEHPD